MLHMLAGEVDYLFQQGDIFRGIFTLRKGSRYEGALGCQVTRFSLGRIVVNDISKFVFFNFLQCFSSAMKRFKSFCDGFCYAFVGFLGASDDGELLGRGNSFVSIGMIQANAE